ITRRLKREHQPLKALQERVVQLAGNARPLLDPFFHARVEFSGQPEQTEPVQSPDYGDERCRARRVEPRRLVEPWIEGELECVAGCVPYAVVIRGDHAEAVLARAQVRILRLAVVDDFLPVQVLSLEHVFEMDPLRRYQAQRSVVDPYVASVGG